MNEMCILEHLIDVESFKAICKNSRVISLTRKTVLCIYLMAIIFKDRSSFKVLCNIEAFFLFACEEGPIAEN